MVGEHGLVAAALRGVGRGAAHDLAPPVGDVVAVLARDRAAEHPRQVRFLFFVQVVEDVEPAGERVAAAAPLVDRRRHGGQSSARFPYKFGIECRHDRRRPPPSADAAPVRGAGVPDARRRGSGRCADGWELEVAHEAPAAVQLDETPALEPAWTAAWWRCRPRSASSGCPRTRRPRSSPRGAPTARSCPREIGFWDAYGASRRTPRDCAFRPGAGIARRARPRRLRPGATRAPRRRPVRPPRPRRAGRLAAGPDRLPGARC